MGGEKKHICVYLFEDGLSVFKSHEGGKKDVMGEKERKGHSVGSDQRGYFVQGNCSVLLLWQRKCKLAVWVCDLSWRKKED